MQSKAHFFPLFQETPPSNVFEQVSDAEATEALENSRTCESDSDEEDTEIEEVKKIEVIHENKKVRLKFLAGGGAKVVFALNDHTAIALRNLTVDPLDVIQWKRITEGFHRKMKLIQRRAYGFKNFENYRLRVKVLCA